MGPRSDFSKPCQGVVEKSANATRKALTTRFRCGSQPVGMSTREAAAYFASPNNSPFVVTVDNMDIGCVELLLRDGRKISIDKNCRSPA